MSSLSIDSIEREYVAYVIAREPLGPAAPFDIVGRMLETMDWIVRLEPECSWDAPPHRVAVVRSLDSSIAAARVGVHMGDRGPGPEPVTAHLAGLTDH